VENPTNTIIKSQTAAASLKAIFKENKQEALRVHVQGSKFQSRQT
jgi:Fe-S cluster assembly iron-binding protein IscA